jgi:amidase
MARVHAFTDDALGDLDAVGLTEALTAGRVSIPEVVEAAIARTEQVDSSLNAVAVECFDRARFGATDPRGGFFAGVPTFVKDNSDLAGLPTMHGTDAFDPRPARRDGDFARMFLATGVIPLGKTQVSEYGFSAVAEHPRLGAVRNPWDTDHTAGASSSGSAALVAAGAVPLAHANDGGGSIRIPAAVNGLVGLKPTRGRIAQDAMVRKLPVRVVAEGVVTRSVRDTAAFLREAEKVYRDLRLAPVGDVTGPTRARRRVAVVTDGVGVQASPEVEKLTRQTAELVESLGHDVEWIEQPVPTSFKDDFLLYWGLLASTIMATGRLDHGRSWDRSKHDLLTLGLDRHCRRHLAHVPAPSGGCARRRGSPRTSPRRTTWSSPRPSPTRPRRSAGWTRCRTTTP